MPALAFALRYAAIGLHSVPIEPHEKKPAILNWQTAGSTDTTQLTTWFGETERNIGILCSLSNIVVIDIDPRNGGEETFMALVDAHGMLPRTWTNESGGGGAHLIFRRPPGDLVSKLGDGIDILRDGRQFLVEPSVHPSGSTYHWRTGHAPWETEIAELPETWRKAITASAPVRYVVDMPPCDDEIKRKRASAYVAKMPAAVSGQNGHGALWDVTRELVRGFDLDVSTARAIIVNEYNQRCDPPWSAREIEHKLTQAAERSTSEVGYRLKVERPQRGRPAARPTDDISAARARRDAPPPTDTTSAGYGPGGGYRLTDLGNARRFADMHGSRLRYVHTWNQWLVWDGKRWHRDDTGIETQAAKLVVGRIYHEAGAIVQTAAQAINAGESSAPSYGVELVKHASSTSKAARIGAMVQLARSEPEFAASRELFDRDPYALNVNNGTIDLRDGELRPHRQTDMLTMLAPVDYDPLATCPAWEAFLARVLPDADTRDWVQRYLGYGLTGDVREQCLAFFVGGGANGKSVLLDVVLGIMGDYGLRAAPDLVVQKYGETHPTEVADLEGRRLAVCSEIEQGRTWAESTIKRITGDATIKARRMREDFYTFRTSHKLLVAANTRPSVRGTDHGIWRRMRLVMWTVTIPDHEQDRLLPDRLLASEAPGILAWLVRGCLAWQRLGLGSTSAIDAGTQAYRAEQDTLGRWLEDRCIVTEQAWCADAGLYASYREWCEGEGLDRWTRPTWRARLLERHGMVEGKENRGSIRVIRGLRLRDPNESVS